MKTKLTAKKYYKTIDPVHMTGDIWMGLPTLGMLKPKFVSGIIVTPACDLANSKVETITFLPIIPIKNWFTSRSFYSEARNTFISISKEMINNIDEILLKNKLLDTSKIEYIDSLIKSLRPNGKKEIEQLARIKNGLNILSLIANNNCESSLKVQDLKFFLGEKNYGSIVAKLLRNSYSNDLYFLPCDREPNEWSAISLHSLVLFRYPITIPIEIFDMAADPGCIHWESAMLNLKNHYSIAQEFTSSRPLKTLSLNNDFLSDLLTRFVGMFVRMGSPDFTNETIIELINEI